jgi:hypothetical protein
MRGGQCVGGEAEEKKEQKKKEKKKMKNKDEEKERGHDPFRLRVNMSCPR